MSKETLVAKLDAIGDAIRYKTGKSPKLLLSEMPDEIKSITARRAFEVLTTLNGESTTKGAFYSSISQDALDEIRLASLTSSKFLFSGSMMPSDIDLGAIFGNGAQSLKSLEGCMANTRGVKTVTLPNFRGRNTTTYYTALNLNSMFLKSAATEVIIPSGALAYKLVDMTGMFAYANISKFIMHDDNVGFKSLSSTFNNNNKLETVSIRSATTSKTSLNNCCSSSGIKKFEIIGTFSCSDLREAFRNCVNLEEVDLSAVVFEASYGDAAAGDVLFNYCFDGCTALKKLILPDSFANPYQTSTGTYKVQAKFPIAMQDEDGNQYAADDVIPDGGHTYTAV